MCTDSTTSSDSRSTAHQGLRELSLCVQEPRLKMPSIFPSLALSAVPPSFDEDICDGRRNATLRLAATNKGDGRDGHFKI